MRLTSATATTALALAALLTAQSIAQAQPRDNDWYLHRPSTPAERTQTRALNRDYLVSDSQAAPAPVDPDADYQRAQQQYEREMQGYRAAEQRYEQALRAFYAGAYSRHGSDRQPRPAMGFQPPPRPHRPQTAQEIDNDPFAPTGGVVDDRIAAPTPGLDGATIGLTQFNARASGLVPPRPRRPYRDPYYYPPAARPYNPY